MLHWRSPVLGFAVVRKTLAGCANFVVDAANPQRELSEARSFDGPPSPAFEAPMSSLRRSLAALMVFAAPAMAQTQTGQAAPALPPTPAAGDVAPDFTAQVTDSTGKVWPVSLSGNLKGKVVVLAFYPGDRTTGCTIELKKFRDEYGAIFGSDVVVLPTSVDSLGSHTSWAKDEHFPFAMIADTKGEVAAKFGSNYPGRAMFRRTTFVIGKDGKIAYADPRFNVNSQDAYDKLAAAVKAAK
jgi:peroxiredoxin Q/BCP